LLEPARALVEQAALRPIPEQRARKFDALPCEPRRGQRYIERCADVLLLGPQPPEARQLAMMTENRQGSTELIEEELEVPLAQAIGGIGLDEPLARVLAKRFQEPISMLASALAFDDDH
jgi:hypothetical protein